MATENKKLIIAKASHVLSSPRKTNLILKAITGRSAQLVLKQLAVYPQRAAEPIAKLIKQAIGNAVSTQTVSPESLVIDSAFATKGRTLKRAHIGGRGRTKPYERISSHLTLYLRANAPKVTTVAKTTKVTKETKAVKSPKVSKSK